MFTSFSDSHLETSSLPREILWLLEEGFFGYVGTSSREREPHVTPVIFAFYGSHVYFLTSKRAKKLRNMERNPSVAFLIDIRDPEDLLNNRAVLIHGTVKKIGLLEGLLNIRRLLKIRRLFIDKYPKYVKAYETNQGMIPKQWRMTPFRHRVLLRLTLDRFIYMREAFQASLRERGD